MFSHNSFASASFSTASFKMAQTDNSARSGYWRLFYYQMQEEALNKDEQKQRKEAPQGESSRAKKEPVVVAKPTKRVRTDHVDVEPESETEELVVKKRPIYRAPVAALPDVTPMLSVISNELRSWYLQMEPLKVAMLKQKAANDEDEEEAELLLLVA